LFCGKQDLLDEQSIPSENTMTAPPVLNETSSTMEEENADHLSKVKPHRRGFFGGVKQQVSDAHLDEIAGKIVQELSDDEREHAARSSYRYLWKSVNVAAPERDSKELLEDQFQMAKAMAKRFLSSKKGDYPLALKKMKGAIAFRKDMDVDGLRLCFQADQLKDLDDETKARYASYRDHLSQRMTTGRVYACGYDKQGRAIYTIYAARTKDFDPEWFLKESLFNFEKALACTERESGGVEDSITVIGNYTGFQSKHSAPMSISHKFMDSLRQNYPGRVNRVFLLRTPSSFLIFWSLLKPVSLKHWSCVHFLNFKKNLTVWKHAMSHAQFIGTDTRKKIVFLNERHRQEQFADLVSVDQAAPWMLDGGKKTKEFDSVEYLTKIPFDECFDP
jgi:hypothetical protein